MTLHTWLQAGRLHPPEFQGGLSNHLPMVLTALHELGAEDVRLAEFAQRYALRLQTTSAAEREGPPIDGIAQALEHRGELQSYWPLKHCYCAAIAAEGVDATLRATLHALLPGIGAAAWHGLLRTAYARINKDDAELAAGLAYWTARYLDLGAAQALGTEADPVPILVDLAHATADLALKPGLIFSRMQAVSTHPAFAVHVERLRIDTGTLRALSSYAVETYLRTRDFVVLHLITSAHALRLLLPYCAEPLDAIRWYWCSYAAGLIASGIEPGNNAREDLPPATDWNAAIAVATASDDDHLIKLVYSLHCESAQYGDRAWLDAAALAISKA